VALIVAVGTVLFNSRKVQIDESALVLAKWKEFSESHQAEMKRMKEDIAEDRSRYKSEIEALRERIVHLEKELIARDKEIAGLRRTISQVSQSTAVQIGRVKRKAAATDTKLEQDGEENLTEHADINEHLERLDRIGDNIRGAAGGGGKSDE
jgi:predicted RNase H-like nuclease (RuvC/YqgF family)